MKRGYCTSCNIPDESKRIFEVNSESEVCFCPHCLKKYKPSQAINNYNRLIKKHLNQANYLLKNANEIAKAYSLFAYVLELENNNRLAMMGRILSLAYLSTLRRDRFSETLELLKIEKDSFHLVSLSKDYSELLMELDECMNEYYCNLNKRLTFKGYYYDTDCVRLFYQRINSMLELKRLVRNELISLNETTLSEGVETTMKAMEKELSKTLITADGVDHHLINIGDHGTPLVSNGVSKVNTGLEKYRLSCLESDERKLKVIKDKMFRSNKTLYHLSLCSLPISLIVLTALILNIIAHLIFVAPAHNLFFIILSIVSMTILTLGWAGFLSLFIASKLVLKKPRY